MLRESPLSVLVDADHGFGGIACTRALERCLIKASTSGIGVAGVYNSSHLFIPAHYVLRAARQGYIAICTSVAEAVMPPTGGLGRVLGNNPWAFGVPVGDKDPLVLDIAPSASFAKVRMHAAENTPLPEGWALDKDGNPTTDAQAAVEGTLLPLGDHKGYGLAMVSELIAGVLSGNDYGAGQRPERKSRALSLGLGPEFVYGTPRLCAARHRVHWQDQVRAAQARCGRDFLPRRTRRALRERSACSWHPFLAAHRMGADAGIGNGDGTLLGPSMRASSRQLWLKVSVGAVPSKKDTLSSIRVYALLAAAVVGFLQYGPWIR